MDYVANPSILHDAVFVRYYFGEIPGHIAFMESETATFREVIIRMCEVEEKMMTLPDSPFKTYIMEYFRKNVAANPGFKNVMEYFNNGSKNGVLKNWSDEDLECIDNLSAANDDIERIFSVSKALLRTNRQAFNFENFRMKMMSNNVLRKVMW